MIDLTWFRRRPVVIAVAGPNGAGKSTFYRTHLADQHLPFVNADVLAIERAMDAYAAAALADEMRRSLRASGESFVFETVFSDPVGDKVAFIEEAAQMGYEVVLCFIRLQDAALSSERVSIRVAQGEHDVPEDKLVERFPRTLRNLKNAIGRLPHVLVYDNSEMTKPFQFVAAFERGQLASEFEPLPDWLHDLLAENNDQ